MNIYLFIKKSKEETIHELFRFCIVGGLCTFIDIAVFYIVRRYTTYQIALISGYCLSLLLNYYLTIFWTFKKKASKSNAIGIIVAHLFNLFVVRMGLMFVFVRWFMIIDQIAIVPTLIISTITNFFIIRFVVKKL